MLAILFLESEKLDMNCPSLVCKKKNFKIQMACTAFSYLQVRDCIFNSLIFFIGENRRRVKRIGEFQGASDSTDPRIH